MHVVDGCRLHEVTELLSQEAMRRLASGQAWFDSAHVVGLLRAIQAIPESLWEPGTRTAMLDKAASYIVHSFHKDLPHLIAINQPEDFVAILQVYASLQHRSLATEDLLGAFALQVGSTAAFGKS